MSYILKYLDSKSNIEKELNKYPNKLSHYAKYDTFIGDTDAIEYILKLLNEKK